MANSTFAPVNVFSPEVQAFCINHDLIRDLKTTIQLAERSFEPVEKLQIEKETDPETGDEFVLLSVSVAAGVEDVLTRYDAFTRAWVKGVRAVARDLMRVGYDIL